MSEPVLRVTDKWEEERDLVNVSFRVEDLLKAGKRDEAIELLRETVVDKSKIFGATERVGLAVQEIYERATAGYLFSKLRDLGNLPDEFLYLVEMKAGFLDADEIVEAGYRRHEALEMSND